jgi:uncharacterized protein (TIGR02996 family)
MDLPKLRSVQNDRPARHPHHQRQANSNQRMTQAPQMQTTSTLTALHTAIIASPREDLPRLMYADCLEEELGLEAHANFIRCQVAYPDSVIEFTGDAVLQWSDGNWGWPWKGSDKQRRQSAGRIEIADKIPGMALRVRRGFVDEVQCSWEVWAIVYPREIKFHLPVTVCKITGGMPLAVGYPFDDSFEKVYPDITFKAVPD